MKPGDTGVYDVPHRRCMTPDGEGLLVHYEVAYRWHSAFIRYGVILDENLFSYSPAYYPPEQVEVYNNYILSTQ